MNSQKTIFIVDDDTFLLDMYSLKFREAGFHVEIASGGEEALEKIRGGLKPDIMLLDIVMPSIDGVEILRILKKEKLLTNTIIVILSNLSQKQDVQKAIDLGADDYIIKAHFTPSEVVKKVEEILNSRQL